MNVRVLFFGPLVDLTECATLEMTLPDSATVQTMLDALFLKWPALRSWDANLLVAVNLAYAAREEVMPPDAEVAIMPPVQGG